MRRLLKWKVSATTATAWCEIPASFAFAQSSSYSVQSACCRVKVLLRVNGRPSCLTAFGSLRSCSKATGLTAKCGGAVAKSPTLFSVRRIADSLSCLRHAAVSRQRSMGLYPWYAHPREMCKNLRLSAYAVAGMSPGDGSVLFEPFVIVPESVTGATRSEIRASARRAGAQNYSPGTIRTVAR